MLLWRSRYKDEKVPAPNVPDQDYNSQYTQWAPGILSGTTCCHSIRVRANQSERPSRGEAGRSYRRPIGGILVVARDRRRRELTTGGFSLLQGVVALLPLCEVRVRACPRACVRVGPVVLVGPR
ncbi:hypothetical protein J1605_009579 [Eschrichtius robustus]|uniref:Uncharacterized protein n=1 Tax=Eschrichtius robustus TaxID=9764 RepID=A0AB34GU20_ESCRO|nr:hypothetical protein J1605_009579 [Eschrichtius robustus]